MIVLTGGSTSELSVFLTGTDTSDKEYVDRYIFRVYNIENLNASLDFKRG